MESKKQIKEFPEYFIYNDGRVYSSRSNSFRKPTISNNGYLCIKLTDVNGAQKGCVIHKLVAEYFLNAADKTQWIKFLDGNKQNPHFENIEYCRFRDLMIKGKSRKMSITRILFIDKIDVYKYYFQFVPEKRLPGFLRSLSQQAERIIISQRWEFKTKLSIREKIFKSYCQGKDYDQLIKLYKVSRYAIKEAIYQTRIALIDAINDDVKKRILKYNPIVIKKGLSRKKISNNPIEKWEQLKRENGII